MLKPRLEKFYDKVVCEDFILLYNFKNISQIPSFERAVLNSTSKNFLSSKFSLLQSFSALSLGTSQKCVNTRARKSIALFGIREMNILGLKVTLRKVSFYTMLDKLLIFVLPKVILYSKVFGKILEDRESTKTLKAIQLRKEENRFVPLKLSKENKALENLVLYPSLCKSAAKDKSSGVTRTTDSSLFLFLKRSFEEKRKNKQNFFCEKNISPVSQRFSRSFFTINNKNSLCFPEISQLLNFFDMLPGFSIVSSLKVSHKSNYPKKDSLTNLSKSKGLFCLHSKQKSQIPFGEHKSKPETLENFHFISNNFKERLLNNSSIACTKRNERKKVLLSAFQLPIYSKS